MLFREFGESSSESVMTASLMDRISISSLSLSLAFEESVSFLILRGLATGGARSGWFILTC